MKEIITKNGKTLSIISKGGCMPIVDKLKESVEAKTFIEMAIEDDDVLRLLCTHRSTLSVFEKFNYPMLFSIKRGKKAKSTHPFALVAAKETAKSQHTIEHMIERAKPTIKRFYEKFMGRYTTLFEDIGVEADSLVYQEEREQEILTMIISQMIVQDFADEEKIMKIVKMFEDFVIDDFVPVVLMFMNSLKKEFIDFGIKNREKIVHASGLDETQYENIINKLEIEYKVIKPLVSIFWCENQRHEHYSFFMLSHSSVPTIKCPLCDKTLSIATFYFFIPDVCCLLRNKEGLIQALSIYLVDKSGKDWAPSVYLKEENNDTEKDIVIRKKDNKYILMEIKTFATDVSLRTKKEHVKQLLNQALKHLTSYLTQDIIIENFYLITNYWVDAEINDMLTQILSQKKFSKLKKVNLEIIGPNNIKKLYDLQEIQE